MIANRAHTRGFRAILPKVQKTMDWMVDDAVWSEPISLLCREKTGNFGDSTYNRGHRACKKLSLYAWIRADSLLNRNGEFFAAEQGSYASEQGFKTSNQGKRVLEQV